jgi:hypothetical protein
VPDWFRRLRVLFIAPDVAGFADRVNARVPAASQKWIGDPVTFPPTKNVLDTQQFTDQPKI